MARAKLPAASRPGVFAFAFKATALVAMVLTPLLGVWIASSLAAYANGRTWVPLVAGLALFPGLPLLWEAWASHRRGRDPKVRARKRFLTFGDRLVLRTLAVNVAFLAGMLAIYPERAFVALASRGDWMLGGRHGPTVDRVRSTLFLAAGGLEWLYRAAHRNPYEDDQPHRKPDEPPPSTGSASPASPTASPAVSSIAPPAASTPPTPSAVPAPAASGVAGVEPAPQPTPSPAPAASSWPMAAKVHPVVAAMPREGERSIADVARYIASREPNETLRFKALHDWVADRIAYDAGAYLQHRVPRSDGEATAVFETRVGVCAGYAHLLEQLGKDAGFDVVYVTGDARTMGDPVNGEPHAWNAVRIAGQWQLVDATWDAGFLRDGAFHKEYASDYLFAPAEVFGVSHYPDDAAWQLRSPHLSRGDFVRQPTLRPAFFAHGLTLLTPDRGQVGASGTLEVLLDNPRGWHVMVDADPHGGGGERARCLGDGRTRATCTFPTDGTWDVEIFGNDQELGTYEGVGGVEVTSRR